MRNLLLCCFCFAVFTCSCGGKKKGDVLSADKMTAVMLDMLQADAFTESYLKKDSAKNIFIQNAALQQKIFELHKINKEDFYESYEYYSARPDVMRNMLDSMTARAQRERDTMMKQKYAHPLPALKPAVK